jgi:hypothetical protein
MAALHMESVGRHAGYDLFSPSDLPHGSPVLQSTHPLPPLRMNHPRSPYFFSKAKLEFTPNLRRHCTSAPLAYAEGHTLYCFFTFR